MSAADAREELEAMLWRHLPRREGRQPANAQGRAVGDILAKVDEYAIAYAAEAIGGAVRAS